MMHRFLARDLKAVNQKKLPRVFDLIIGEDGEPVIETKNDKVSRQISLKEVFEQASKAFQLRQTRKLL